MYFPSKKDVWMTILIWVCIFAFVFPPIFVAEITILGMIIPVICAIFLGWVWFQTGYMIESETLFIKCGPIKLLVKIADIEQIRLTKNPFTAPALSMDKIEIQYAPYRTVQISPIDQQQFIEQLLKHNPTIKIDQH
ncbi:PH domain-containing protein [Alkalihalobacillus sp. LMS39]|uniref:PH domain-containing protein n=1 Tax=Alkalihalobacillus sp. LMS39 TaxID=2924032 RepID=UPI001FB53E34|nr:PH domain-containing protein [Alkalihalobacillus sp. LMS39]UOE95038.1 PH domain-containing protein [Alkalihalobacillus sp. LMS39]